MTRGGSTAGWAVVAALSVLAACSQDKAHTPTDPLAIMDCAAAKGASVRWDPLAGGSRNSDGEEFLFDDQGNTLAADQITDGDVQIYRSCMTENGVDFVSQEEVDELNEHLPPFVECMQKRGYDVEVLPPYRLTGQLGVSSMAGQQPNDVVNVDTRECAAQVGWDIVVADENSEFDEHD